jgi:hypothetical protein
VPFKNTDIAVRTSDGRNITLLEDLVYVTDAGETITVPIGATADGCSTPREVWNLLPPFGQYWMAAVLHDFLYRKTARPQAECDLLFLEAMKSLDVDLLVRETIYEGVHLGGSWAFNDDRRLKLQALAARHRV